MRYVICANDYAEVLRGHIAEDKYWDKFFNSKVLTKKLNIEQAKQIFSRTICPVNQDVVKALLNTGLKVYIHSDINLERIKELKKRPEYAKMLDGFNGAFYSYDIGYTKHEPEAFRYITKSLKVDPSNIIFVDDDPKNIKNARKLGIRAILFKNPEQLKSDLSSLIAHN